MISHFEINFETGKMNGVPISNIMEFEMGTIVDGTVSKRLEKDAKCMVI